MRNIKMSTPRYPFSDLTSDEVQALMAAARQERVRTIRAVVAALLALPRAFRLPPRQRQAQVWPSAGVPALSLKTYR
jgi:hypothetical protein